MTRERCSVCLGRGKEEVDAYHEIAYDGKYIHLCDTHFWMLEEYFRVWIK